MTRFSQTKKDKDIILSYHHEIYCIHCDDKQFSGYDKLYTAAVGKCVDCSTEEEMNKYGNRVLEMIERTI